MGGGFGLINTDEDCLHLSVHVPVQQGGDGPLAVMVWTIIIIKLSLKSWAPPKHNHHHHCSGVDIKQWTNCRVGMLGWALLSLNFALVSNQVGMKHK